MLPSKPTARLSILTLALVAKLGFVAFLLFGSRSNELQSYTNSIGAGRQLSSILNVGVSAELATSTTPPLFSYGFSSDPDECISPQEVSDLASALRDLYDVYGIRAFPRNDFLLGIIRHGGFLPNENESTADAELGIVFFDVHEAQQQSEGQTTITLGQQGDPFPLTLEPNEIEPDNQWNGINPLLAKRGKGHRTLVRHEKYKVFGVNIRRGTLAFRANCVYKYRPDGTWGDENWQRTHFYPVVNTEYSHIQELVHYNEQGARYELLGINKLLTEDNYEDGLEIGSVLPSDLTCMTLRQFYFTTIYVPCDYEAILTSFYGGTNWNDAVESDAQQGPKPLCGDIVKSASKSIF